MKINVSFKCSFFLEDNNGTIDLGVKHVYANRAITVQSWDYFVYLRDLAVHKDHLPHHRLTSQTALLL